MLRETSEGVEVDGEMDDSPATAPILGALEQVHIDIGS
jgi:hypothetical protein